jgi:hypothetical protein
VLSGQRMSGGTPRGRVTPWRPGNAAAVAARPPRAIAPARRAPPAPARATHRRNLALRRALRRGQQLRLAREHVALLLQREHALLEDGDAHVRLPQVAAR